MDENKEKDKWYYSKRFTPILIFFAIAIICFASSRAANAPNLVIEQNVVDTQEYLPEGKGFFDTNNIGKRYKLLCRIIDDPEKNWYGYYYTYVADLRSKYEIFNGFTFHPALISEEELPRDRYIELECLVTGHYNVKYNNDSGKVGETFPVLKVLQVNNSDCKLIDYTAPLIKTEKINQSVSENGLTLTLDKIEYRGKLNRYFFTIENKSGRIVIITNPMIKCNGIPISGISIANGFAPDKVLEKLYEKDDEILFSNMYLENNTKQSAAIMAAPVEKGSTIKCEVNYFLPKEDTFEAIANTDMQTLTIELTEKNG